MNGFVVQGHIAYRANKCLGQNDWPGVRLHLQTVTWKRYFKVVKNIFFLYCLFLLLISRCFIDDAFVMYATLMINTLLIVEFYWDVMSLDLTTDYFSLEIQMFFFRSGLTWIILYRSFFLHLLEMPSSGHNTILQQFKLMLTITK